MRKRDVEEARIQMRMNRMKKRMQRWALRWRTEDDESVEEGRTGANVEEVRGGGAEGSG